MTLRIAITTDGQTAQRTTEISFTDLWYRWLDKPADQHARRQSEYFPTAGVREDVASEPRTDREGKRKGGRGHTRECQCEACLAQLAGYQQSVNEDLPIMLLRRRVAVLSIALSTNPVKASDVLKRFHKAHAHYAELSEAFTASEQCRYMARTYDMAAAIVWRRMRHYAETRHDQPMVQARSEPSMLGGRTDVANVELFECEQCVALGRIHA